MQVAVKSYLAAGIATVGVGAVALSPVSPVVPQDIHLPSVQVSTPVQLAAAINPIQAYLDLVGNTVNNLSSIGQSLLENPAPILQQILANQFASAGELLSALQDAGGQLLENVGTIVPEQLQQALANLAAGNIVGVGQNVVNIIVQPILFPTLTLLPALQTFLEQPVANLLAVTQQFTTIAALGGLGALSPLASGINATAQAIQNIVDAARTGDVLGAVSAIAAVPAVIADGVLNGFGFDGGVLSPGLGLAGALLQIRNIIATALGAPVAATTTGLAEANATTTKAATTVTLSTDSVAAPSTTSASPKPEADGTEAAGGGSAAKDSGSAEGTTGEASATTTDSADGATSAAETKTEAASTAKEDTTKDATSKGDSAAKDAASTGDTSTAKADDGAKKASDTEKDAATKKDADSSAKASTK